MIKLASDYRTSLINQPESGMGFQFVEARLNDNQTRNCIAYNCEELTYLGDSLQLLFEKSSDIRLQEVYKAETQSMSGRIVKLTVVEPTIMFKSASFKAFGESVESRQAANASLDKTNENERFIRFSAYKNDSRITPQQGLHPGTYATTEDDARHIRRGIDAVARYALPNPQPAIYVFKISPPQYTSIRRGTVQPAYGQPGGGIEVIFPDGTPKNTVSGPNEIPR